MIENAAIYKILKLFPLEGSTTSEALLKKRYFKKTSLSTLNSTLSNLANEGYVFGSMRSGLIVTGLTDKGKSFLRDYRYVSRLTMRDRVIDFALGFVSGVLSGYVVNWLAKI